MNEHDYDLIVIGAGPAGYTASLRAAQLGLKTACIDQWRNPEHAASLGGACLNAGCIPSKALLESSLRFARARDEFGSHGILFDNIHLDLNALQMHKRAVVKQQAKELASLFSAHGVTWLKGHGRLLGKNRVAFTVHGRKRPKELSAEHIILAPGSHPTHLDTTPVDGTYIVDPEGALNFTEIPKRLAIIGAGVIGLELGSIWRRFGSEVVLLEAQTSFLPIADTALSQLALETYREQGLQIKLGTRVKETRIHGQAVTLQYVDTKSEYQERFDRVIVAVGRRPNTNGLYSDHSGLQLDERRFIGVDAQCRTNLPGVWAIGDAIRGPMFAHKGTQEGIMVIERIAGKPTKMDPNLIPSVIYTDPEFAWVGPSEDRLKQAGIPYRCGRFPVAANSRAQTQGRHTGEVKLLAHAQTDRLLAAHIFTPNASELIAQIMITLSMQGSSEDLARTLFVHPSLAEIVHEAALDVSGQALHIGRHNGDDRHAR